MKVIKDYIWYEIGALKTGASSEASNL
jgi:hypothetical protein